MRLEGEEYEGRCYGDVPCWVHVLVVVACFVGAGLIAYLVR